jgi:hypothetical protein
VRRITIAAFVALCVAACGGQDENHGAASPDRSPSGDDFVIRTVDSGGGGDGGSSTPGTVEPTGDRPDLRLSARLAGKTFEVGKPILAKLNLQNLGEKAYKLFDPDRSIPGSIRCSIKLPSGRNSEVVYDQRIPEGAIKQEDLVDLGPGDSVSVDLDIGPAIRKAGDGELGEYVVEIHFTGGHRGKRLTMNLWNRAAVKETGAAPVTFELRWPTELADMGVTPEIDRQVAELLADAGPEGRMTEQARLVLTNIGEGIYPSLVRQLERASSTSHPDQVIAWNAYHYLLEDDDALDHLIAEEHTSSPLKEFLTRWLECSDRRERRMRPDPEEVEFRTAVLDPNHRKKTAFRLTRSANAGRVTEILYVNGFGLVKFERHENGKVTAKNGRLSEKDRDAMFTELVKHRFWLHGGVRNHGSESEALVTIEHLLVSSGAEGPPEDVVHRIEVWESEATIFNRSLGAIVTALRGAKLALRR